MARYTDYIKSLDADDGAPEGSGSLILRTITVEGFGLDGNYLRGTIPVIQISSSGINRSVGIINIPSLTIEAYSGTHGKILLPVLSVNGTRGHDGAGRISLPHLQVLGDGMELPPPGGYIDLPPLGLTGRGGPLIKIYQLCVNENLGL